MRKAPEKRTRRRMRRSRVADGECLQKMSDDRWWWWTAAAVGFDGGMTEAVIMGRRRRWSMIK